MFLKSQNKNRLLKSKIGSVLLKLKGNGLVASLNADEQNTAKILVSEGLIKYRGPADLPTRCSPEDFHAHQWAVANSTYFIEGNGAKLLGLYSEKQLLSGMFKLAGEKEWHDTFWGKVVLSGLTALVTYVIVGIFQALISSLFPPKETNPPASPQILKTPAIIPGSKAPTEQAQPTPAPNDLPSREKKRMSDDYPFRRK